MNQQRQIYNEYKTKNERIMPTETIVGSNETRKLWSLVKLDQWNKPDSSIILTNSPKADNGSGKLDCIIKLNDGRIAEVYDGFLPKWVIWNNIEEYQMHQSVMSEYHYFEKWN